MSKERIVARRLKKVNLDIPVFCARLLDEYTQFIRVRDEDKEIMPDDVMAHIIEKLAQDRQFQKWQADEKAKLEQKWAGGKAEVVHAKAPSAPVENSAGQ